MTGQSDAQQAFREALGSFATGVTIATTVDEGSAPVGVTASSFNSVSLDPPLVLWSLGKQSLSQPAFATSGHFAIHVLAAGQEELSNRFARSGGNKFEGVDWKPGTIGSPVLSRYAALFECRTRHQYEGGDHIIMVGEVVDFDSRDEAPLLFHGGRYAEHRPRSSDQDRGASDPDHGRYNDDFLFQLIAQAYFLTSAPTREKAAQIGLTLQDDLVLGALSMDAPLPAQSIAEKLDRTGHAPDVSDLDRMVGRGLLHKVEDGYDLDTEGRRQFLEILAVGKAFETDLVDHFTEEELAQAKHVLRRVIALARSGP